MTVVKCEATNCRCNKDKVCIRKNIHLVLREDDWTDPMECQHFFPKLEWYHPMHGTEKELEPCYDKEPSY